MQQRTRVGELRPSQLITTFGPGAIVDLPELSVIVAGIDLWNKKLCQRITEPRLQAKLEIEAIYAPPLPEGDSKEPTLPTFRFPEYMVCPTCRLLAPFRKFADPKGNGVKFCNHMSTPLQGKEPSAKAFPVRFVVVCPHGHIHDLPWEDYVHGNKNAGGTCEGGRLTLEELGATGSIGNVMVRCSCGAARSLADAFADRSGKALGKCQGWRPWLGPEGKARSCGKPLRAMLRGASNAYFPIVVSALTIPPHADNPAIDIVGDVEDRLVKAKSLEHLRESFDWFPEAEARGITPEQLWAAWKAKDNIPKGPEQDLYYPEWLELLKGSQADGAYDFETQEQTVPDLFNGFVDRLVQVKRLREVRVLSGFTRIDPPADVTTIMSGEAEAQPTSTRASVSKYPKPFWLPGVMVRGEGIFFTLNEQRLQQWEQDRQKDGTENALRVAHDSFCKDRNLEPPPPFPEMRYVLLHTLSHAVMRQLGLNSGYSSTALRERIYSRTEQGEEMAGVLIYTATPDSEGSLGGLVEQGQTVPFGTALWQCLQEAQFCSGDPLCAEHDPREHHDLNGAACHACALVAETSCERSNRYLDRALLVPTVSRLDRGFFGEIFK